MLNNVDLRPFGEHTLITATQRLPAAIALFTLDHQTREITHVANHQTELRNPYGLCMFQDDRTYVIANGKDGNFVQYLVQDDLSLIPLRRWQTQSQPEGCVADDQNKKLYFGEEEVGIWEISADPEAATDPLPFDRIENGNLVADVEGLTLYRTEQQTYLIASSQGDDSFAIYDTNSRKHLLTFQIRSGKDIDGATETDGIDATESPLPGYPDGIFVAQDGYNLKPFETQNFKIVSWQKVAQHLP